MCNTHLNIKDSLLKIFEAITDVIYLRFWLAYGSLPFGSDPELER